MIDLSNYKVNELTGCWEWRGMRNHDGYGQVWVRALQRNVGAHRISFEQHKGPIPEGLLICHTCDNPPCINPDHLFAGTHKDNTADMMRKGRQPVYMYRPRLKWPVETLEQMQAKMRARWWLIKRQNRRANGTGN